MKLDLRLLGLLGLVGCSAFSPAMMDDEESEETGPPINGTSVGSQNNSSFSSGNSSIPSQSQLLEWFASFRAQLEQYEALYAKLVDRSDSYIEESYFALHCKFIHLLTHYSEHQQLFSQFEEDRRAIQQKLAEYAHKHYELLSRIIGKYLSEYLHSSSGISTTDQWERLSTILAVDTGLATDVLCKLIPEDFRAYFYPAHPFNLMDPSRNEMSGWDLFEKMFKLLRDKHQLPEGLALVTLLKFSCTATEGPFVTPSPMQQSFWQAMFNTQALRNLESVRQCVEQAIIKCDNEDLKKSLIDQFINVYPIDAHQARFKLLLHSYSVDWDSFFIDTCMPTDVLDSILEGLSSIENPEHRSVIPRAIGAVYQPQGFLGTEGTSDRFEQLLRVAEESDDLSKRIDLYNSYLSNSFFPEKYHDHILDFIESQNPSMNNQGRQLGHLLGHVAKICERRNFGRIIQVAVTMASDSGCYLACRGILLNPRFPQEYRRQLMECTAQFQDQQLDNLTLDELLSSSQNIWDIPGSTRLGDLDPRVRDNIALHLATHSIVAKHLLPSAFSDQILRIMETGKGLQEGFRSTLLGLFVSHWGIENFEPLLRVIAIFKKQGINECEVYGHLLKNTFFPTSCHSEILEYIKGHISCERDEQACIYLPAVRLAGMLGKVCSKEVLISLIELLSSFEGYGSLYEAYSLILENPSLQEIFPSQVPDFIIKDPDEREKARLLKILAQVYKGKDFQPLCSAARAFSGNLQKEVLQAIRKAEQNFLDEGLAESLQGLTTSEAAGAQNNPKRARKLVRGVRKEDNEKKKDL